MSAPSQPKAKPRPAPAPTNGKLRTVTAHQATLDLARGAASQTGCIVLISQPGKAQPLPVGQLVQLFFKKHDKGSKPTKLAEAKTAANGQVTFRYKVPANVAGGVYRIWAKYPGGGRWEPSESGQGFVTVR